jgi:hypothetical protein
MTWVIGDGVSTRGRGRTGHVGATRNRTPTGRCSAPVQAVRLRDRDA